MADVISLVKVFGGSASYIADHEANYTTIESAINALYATVQGTATSGSVDLRLNELYDRNGIFGKASYKPVAATLSPSPYNLTVAAGAYYDGTSFRKANSSTLIPLLSFSTGTLYVNVPTGGIPTVSSSPTADTVWQFAWNDTTHVVSSVVFYDTTAEILLDGDDYAECIDGYDGLAARLDAIASGGGFLAQEYAEDSANHSGLNFAYFGGNVHNDNVVTTTVDGTVALTDTTTNYIEVNISTGAVTANTSGFTAGRIPLFTAVTSGGSITVVTDKRTWARGGGSGSHAQNTDVGTDASEFKLLRTVTGTPSSDAFWKVERGTSPDVSIKWNETLDKWQFTNDGSTFSDLGSGSGGDPGSNDDMTQYVPLDDPDLIEERLAISTDGAYVQNNIGPSGSAYITSGDAPQGVTALVLRVAFWDTTPGSGVNVKFKNFNAIASPLKAFTVWGGTAEHSGFLSTLVIPGTDGTDIGYESLVTASGAGTANVRVWLMGYFKKVTGVGTQTKAFSSTGNACPSATATNFNKTGFVNRGLCYLLKLTETGGTSTGTYDVAIYSKDTFLAADLLYQATGIDSTANSRIYTDRLPFMYLDDDATSELHIKITNNDGAQAMTFTFALTLEQFS
jgi:hypothetical protein